MHGEQVLARDTRAFIVLVALLQGGLLYLARQGHALGWWPFDALPGRICWYTLVLGVPTAMTLSVLHLRDRRFWTHALLLAAVFLPLAAWAGWNAGGAAAVDASPVLGPFGLSMSLGLFVALPWLQCRLASGRWRAHYPALFEHAWQNALTLALALLFTGICWAVLVLWGQLFALVQITFFRELFREDAFVHLATGAMAGLGILIGRTQQRPVQIARQVLFAIFKGLLPLLAFIAVLFVASLPFTGLAPLWQTRSAATLLVGVIALLVLFANAVYQDGEGQPPYPLWLRRLVEAGLLALPVYALLALYAMSLRIGQYGWTSDRVWALLVTVMAALYAGGYAIAVLRRGRTWLPLLGRINMHLSWVLIALVVLVDSPLLDPHRIGVASTVARVSAAAPELDEADLRYLRFDAGRRGYEALQQLRDAPGFAGADAARQRIERFIARTSRWGGEDEPAGQSRRIDDVATLRRQIVPIGGSADADPSWWEALADDTVPAERCRDAGADCLLLRRDFDNDGRDEVLLCDAVNEYMLSCMLHSFGDGRWQQAGGISLWAGDADREAFRAGRIELLMPRWAQIRVGKGAPQRIEPSTVADGYHPLPAPHITPSDPMSGYCDIAPGHPLHGPYHDTEYGFPQRGEAELFERLILEINQAGLSWETMLKKRDGFRRAFHGFDVDAVAAYGEADRSRLLADAGIIRNRLKVDAVIHNAGVIQQLRASHGSFAGWLDAHHPLPKADWVKLFKKTFRFTGGEITGEFLMSLGYLPGAHRESCPVHARLAALSPPWMR